MGDLLHRLLPSLCTLLALTLLLGGAPSRAFAGPPAGTTRVASTEAKGRDAAAKAQLDLARDRSTAGIVIGAVLLGGGAAMTGIGAVQWGLTTREAEGFDYRSAPWVYVTAAGLSVVFVGVGFLMFGLDQREVAKKIEKTLALGPSLPPLDPAAVPALANAPLLGPADPGLALSVPLFRF